MIPEGILISLSIVALFYIILHFYQKFKTRRLRKKYNPDDDTSKKGEERGRGFGKREGIGSSIAVTPRPFESEGGGILPTTDISTDGKDSKSTRGFFNRRKRRKE